VGEAGEIQTRGDHIMLGYAEVGHAFVVVDSGSTVTEEDLREHCRARLANYKVPKQFTIATELPLLPIGKIDKQALRGRLGAIRGGNRSKWPWQRDCRRYRPLPPFTAPYRRYTTLPATIVATTFASLIASGAIAVRSWSRTAMSACIPGRRTPVFPSR